MNDKTLSVCLLVYNHAHLIEKIIKSVINQTFRDFELIISDDNSTDNTFNVCSFLATQDERIRLIKTKNNLGMAGNANFAISQSKYNYIALLHHDDLLYENAFAEWLKCIRCNDRIAFVFNEYKTKVAKSKKELSIIKNFTSVIEGKYFLKNFLLKYWGCPVRGTALIRKKYFDEIGGMNEKFGLIADVDLWMRLSANWDVGYVDKPLIEVLQERPENYPTEYTEFSWKRFFILFDIHSANINRTNYQNYFQYLLKRFLFMNKVSSEIIKWHIYGVARKKYSIIKEYPPDSTKYEYFYSALIRKFIKIFAKEATHRKD